MVLEQLWEELLVLLFSIKQSSLTVALNKIVLLCDVGLDQGGEGRRLYLPFLLFFGATAQYTAMIWAGAVGSFKVVQEG